MKLAFDEAIAYFMFAAFIALFVLFPEQTGYWIYQLTRLG